MDKLGLVLFIFSFVCFVIAAFYGDPHRPRLIAAGLAFLSAAFVFGNMGMLFKGG